MEDIITIILVVIGAILVYFPSQKLKSRNKTERMPRRVFWRLMAMYVIGAAMIAGGFVIAGI